MFVFILVFVYIVSACITHITNILQTLEGGILVSKTFKGEIEIV